MSEASFNPTLNSTLRRWVATIDLAAPGERARSARVSVYAVATAHGVGLDAEVLPTVRAAAELANAGVLAGLPIPDLDWWQPTPLEALEFAQASASAISTEPLLAAAAGLVRQRFEPWEVAEPAARCVAIGYAFDALTFPGASTFGVNEREAIATIRRLAGERFDPRVSECLLTVQSLIQPVGL